MVRTTIGGAADIKDLPVNLVKGPGFLGEVDPMAETAKYEPGASGGRKWHQRTWSQTKSTQAQKQSEQENDDK